MMAATARAPNETALLDLLELFLVEGLVGTAVMHEPLPEAAQQPDKKHGKLLAIIQIAGSKCRSFVVNLVRQHEWFRVRVDASTS
jgi:hypothetical protein